MAAQVGTVEGVRRRNLSRLLTLVHQDGPISRAALTDATGLNRSTIGDLVAELVAAGYVDERAPDPSRRVGRPSPVVTARNTIVALVANPEVDAIEIAAVGLDRSIRARVRLPQQQLLTPERTAQLIAEQRQAWVDAELADSRILGVGLAVPGLVRASDGLVRHAPHLEWRDAPLRDLVEAGTGLPTTVGNDASLGAIAEHRFGAGRDVDDIVYLNGGASGIGGGLIVHGEPVGGVGGYAGEFGQNRPGIDDPADRRADGGVLEDEVSRARLLAAVGLDAADDATLTAALASSGADSVDDELARQRRILATALANAVNVLDPALIVLGGFLGDVAGDGDDLTQLVRAKALHANGEDLHIRRASLAADRLHIGAAELTFSRVLNDPVDV